MTNPTTSSLQTRLDEATRGAVVELAPGEYPGPLVIRQPLVFDGKGATLWARTGPVLAIDGDRVRLRNLRIEVTCPAAKDTPDACALLVCAGRSATLEEGVIVRGGVLGLAGEDGCWRLPEALDAGSLEADREQRRVIRVYVPVACTVESRIDGVTVEPRELKPGANEVSLVIEGLPAETLLFGALVVRSTLLERLIGLTACVGGSGETEGPSLLWEPDDWAELLAGPPPAPAEAPRLPIPAAPLLVAPGPAASTVGLPPAAVVIPGAVAGTPTASPMPALAVQAAGAVPASPPVSTPGSRPISRRPVTGPLVSSVFDEPPPAEEDAPVAAAPPPPAPPPPSPPPPAPAVKGGKPSMRMRPLSKLFDAPGQQEPSSEPPADQQ